MFATKLSFPLTQTAQGKCKERWTPFMELVWGGSVGMALFHPCAQKRILIAGFVCVCSASVIIIVPSVSLPLHVSISRWWLARQSRAWDVVRALSSSLRAQNEAMCALLPYCWVFPLPVFVIHNLHITESSLYSRWCTLYLRSSKSCCTEDKVMSC